MTLASASSDCPVNTCYYSGNNPYRRAVRFCTLVTNKPANCRTSRSPYTHTPFFFSLPPSVCPIYTRASITISSRLTSPLNVRKFQYGAGGRSKQLATSAPRVKLRRACQQQQSHHHRQQVLVQPSRAFVSTSANCRGDQRPRTILAKSVKIGDNPKSIKQRSAMVTSASTLSNNNNNNVTRHFVRTMNGGYLSNPESPYLGHHQQAIRDYLNQTMPLPAQRHTRDRPACQGTRANLLDRSCTAVADVDTTGDRRAGQGRLQQRRSVDATGYVVQRNPSTCDQPRFMDSRNQRHGVIAASVYKDLCNGTIGW